jgi:hypothetical protein
MIMPSQIKFILLLLVLSLFVNCRQIIKVRIIDEPVTNITQDPKHIPASQYQYLTDSLDLFGIYEVPYYYGGLSPSYEIATCYKRMDYYEEGEEGFRMSGGLSMLYENLIIKIDGEYVFINSKEKFQKTFAPIESEEEALAYVSAYTDTYPQYEFDIPFRYRKFVCKLYKSNARKVDTGYITLTYDYQVFGCGPHSHSSVETFVDFDGNVELIKRKRVYEDPREDNLCVD